MSCWLVSVRLNDLTGQRFGRLVVMERAGSSIEGRATWLCVCDCGGTIVTRGYSLTGSMTKSCGCLQREMSVRNCAIGAEKARGRRPYNYRDGLSQTPLGVVSAKYRMTIPQLEEWYSNGCWWPGCEAIVKLQVDHDHKCCSTKAKSCGQCNRGVLCNRHNNIVGRIEWRPTLQQQQEYEQYLQLHKENK